VECYKEAIRAYCEGSFSAEKIADWDSRLKKVFNRGFWNGYYLGQRLGEWNDQYGNKAEEKKLYVGKVIKYFSKLGVAEFLVETQSLRNGEKVLITGPTTGALVFEAEDIRVELQAVDVAGKGARFSMKVPEKVRPSDKLYKLLTNNDI
jgi:putative protease